MRSQKVILNTVVSLLSQIVSITCAFILPRLILEAFGSQYNGITSAITQFLSVIALLRAGIGGATRAALYKGLAKKDYEQISSVVMATELFMRKIAFLFLGCTLIIAIVYPFFVREEFGWFFTFSLVLIISISTFVQYYFGITYQFLLQADQSQYIVSLLEIITIIVNTIISVLLIKAGFSIHFVKLGSAFAFCIMPLVLYKYAGKKYHLDRNARPNFKSIDQRWDAFYHQLAAFIHSNTDVVILTIFTNTTIISIYTVYYLVANGLKKLVSSLSAGVEAAFGDMLAKGEREVFNTNLALYEYVLHSIVLVFFATGFNLITPFIQVYTKGISDANYNQYLFGYLVIIAEALYCLKDPYESTINAAGDFKNTKKFAFIEAGLNISISVVLVINLGLIGVLAGTIISILFRTGAYAIYVSKRIANRSVRLFIYRYFVTFLLFLIIAFICNTIEVISTYYYTYMQWIISGFLCFGISIAVTSFGSFVFFRKESYAAIKKILLTLKRKYNNNIT